MLRRQRKKSGRAGSEVEVWTITGPHLDAQNRFDEPDVVAPTHKVVEAESLSCYRFAARSARLLRWCL